jgi:hypothetical protein
VKFQLDGLEKHSWSGHIPPLLEEKSFDDRNVDHVANMKAYICRTERLRKSYKLFVSLNILHRVAHKTIVDTVITQLITLSGQSSSFGSTCFAVASRAIGRGVRLQDILNTGDWA